MAKAMVIGSSQARISFSPSLLIIFLDFKITVKLKEGACY